MEERIKKQLKMIESGDINGFLNDIDQMAASKAYIVIRDYIKQEHIRAIKESGKDNYQLFQDIKARAKQSWDYDHKLATIEEVNKACMNLYTIVLKLMRAQNDDLQEELGKMQSAINKIEEKVGLEPTVWVAQNNPTDGGNDNVSDVQRVEENI